MDPEYWKEVWKKDDIPFHQSEINTDLKKWIPLWNFPPCTVAFVPLCGKSLDLIWLKEKGFEVLGVEVSEKAVTTFFQEQGIPSKTQQEGAIIRHQGKSLTIYQGDFFDLQKEHLKDVSLIYDRAALVALPAEKRKEYARHLISLLPSKKVTILMITFSLGRFAHSLPPAILTKSKTLGPPFCVEEEEIQENWGEAFEIKKIREEEGLFAEYSRYYKEGIFQYSKKVYCLTSKGSIT